MKTKIFRYKNQLREYAVFGEGKRILYAFHGFGQSPAVWKAFENWLYPNFTVYAFSDLFHGESKLMDEPNGKDYLSKMEIQAYFKAFSLENGHAEINMMAFSSGARTALCLAEGGSLSINELWLFAPDGIKISFWNKLFCKYSFIQKLYLRIADDPVPFFRLIKLANKTGLLKDRLLSFILYSMRTSDKRKLIYHYWMIYRKLDLDMKGLMEMGRQKGIKIHLIFGKRDSVIPPVIGQRFLKDYGDLADLLLLDCQHHLIVKEHMQTLQERFTTK
jgi:pimeloyl-ACP methyl ester carboxylesterase